MQLREEALRKRREEGRTRNSLEVKRSHSRSGSSDNVKRTGISVRILGSRSASTARPENTTLPPPSRSTPAGELRRAMKTIHGELLPRRSLVREDDDSDDTWSEDTRDDRADLERRRLILAGLMKDDSGEWKSETMI